MSHQQPHIVIFSGAGMSVESGLKTFRDNGGLWENHDVNEVATPEAWQRNKELVLRFYNQRRKQLFQARPNDAHVAVAKLEREFTTTVITQNVDDLHERAGSSRVIHLHGELKKVQSEKYPELVYDFEKEQIEVGDLCEKGHQLRPNVVWFGEAVPMMEKAYEITQTADILIVIGTSLNVYPAASIVNFVSANCDCFLIDPNFVIDPPSHKWTMLQTTAVEGMKLIEKRLSDRLSKK